MSELWCGVRGWMGRFFLSFCCDWIWSRLCFLNINTRAEARIVNSNYSFPLEIYVIGVKSKGMFEVFQFIVRSDFKRCEPLFCLFSLPGMHTVAPKGFHCLDPERNCNPCLDAAKACNLNGSCKRQRSAYIATCSKEDPNKGETCSKKRCHKALRLFLDRVPPEFSHRLLFCPCQSEGCAERRRQTIVPDCSYKDKEKPNCLELRKVCRQDSLCRCGNGKWWGGGRSWSGEEDCPLMHVCEGWQGIRSVYVHACLCVCTFVFLAWWTDFGAVPPQTSEDS